MIWDEETQSYVVFLGFTGRSSGLTDPQKQTLRDLLAAHDRSMCIAIHNDGEGSDQEFAALARDLGFKVRTTRSDLKPMPRNRELVSLSAKLLAAPPTDFVLKNGSGSWETIKYMWKAQKPTLVVLSDGSLVSEKEKLPNSPLP